MEREYECPHCGGIVIIEQINCGIFRHGTYKNGTQIPPHMPREECERIKDDIWGCGRPFRFNTGSNKLEPCDYI